jgi:hypothetical protein
VLVLVLDQLVGPPGGHGRPPLRARTGRRHPPGRRPPGLGPAGPGVRGRGAARRGRTLGRLVDLAHATFHEELSLHRAYAAELGLAEADLDRAEKSPVCAAYTDFLLRTAATAEFAEVLAALLPCMWGYSELGRSMAAAGLPNDARYRPSPGVIRPLS